MSLYISVLLGHSYAARKKISVIFSILGIIALSTVFTLFSSLGIQQLKKINFSMEMNPSVHEPAGLILSQQGVSVVLLQEENFNGPRVVSIPGQELTYLAESRAQRGLAATPALPFGKDTGWFINSFSLDFGISAAQIQNRLSVDFIIFIIYIMSLIIFLGSLRFIMDLSTWPLANLFIGVLIFRFILGLEAFLNGTEIQFLISSFLGNSVNPVLITPVIFTCLGVLIIIYTFLSRLAWGKGKKNV